MEIHCEWTDFYPLDSCPTRVTGGYYNRGVSVANTSSAPINHYRASAEQKRETAEKKKAYMLAYKLKMKQELEADPEKLKKHKEHIRSQQKKRAYLRTLQPGYVMPQPANPYSIRKLANDMGVTFGVASSSCARLFNKRGNLNEQEYNKLKQYIELKLLTTKFVCDTVS